MSTTKKNKKRTTKIKETNKLCYYKFDIGNKAWYMNNNFIRLEPITKIIRDENDKDKYQLENSWRYEDSLFQTKQALINSLYIETEKYYKKEK